MSNKTYRKRGNTHVLQNLSYQGSYDIPTKIEMVRYNARQVTNQTILPDQLLIDQIKTDSVCWFKITGFTDVDRISRICKNFGIQRFDIKDLFSNLQVTKIVTYKKATFIMLSGCFVAENEFVEAEQIGFILGENYLISFQENESPVFDGIKAAIQQSHIQLREKGADYLLYILLNCIHTGYNDVIDKVSMKLDRMEEKLINQEDGDENVMKFIRNRRVDYSLIRRSLMPLREEYVNLLHNPNRLILDENIMYFDDFDDRVRTTLDELEIMHETLASLMDLFFNNNNLKMNEIIKRLTIVSTIFIPLTFMVGVWGMNFKIMPELDWDYGYLVSWVILVIIAVIAILFLKKKKWF